MSPPTTTTLPTAPTYASLLLEREEVESSSSGLHTPAGQYRAHTPYTTIPLPGTLLAVPRPGSSSPAAAPPLAAPYEEGTEIL